MERRPLTRGERVLVALAILMLLPVAGMVIAFVLFGQGTPSG
jgi:hypothetical protein